MAERVLGVVPNVRKPQAFGRSYTCTLAVTDSRCVFALLIGQMLQDAAQEAQAQGKAAGQGFMARMAAQLSGHFDYAQRHLAMAPEAALAQNAGNFALDHAAVRAGKLKQGDDEDGAEAELTFEGPAGNPSFKVADCSRETVSLLRSVCGSRLKT
jgi:hypothetical protein